MHHVGSHPRYSQSIQQLEAQISTKIAQKQQEAFSKGLMTPNSSNLGEKINEFVNNCIKNFPASSTGSIFINSTFTVCPQVIVRFSDLRPFFQQKNPQGLLPEEVGKYINVNRLRNPLFGDFTKSPICIQLSNIRFPTGVLFTANEWTLQKAKEYSNIVALNRPTTIGDVDIDPNLKNIRLIADIQYAGYTIRNKEIVAETRDDEELDLIIDLPELTLSGKIWHDGAVYLENGSSFSIDDLIGTDPVTWINVTHKLEMQFSLNS